MVKRGLVWFKNDLRLHDNEALCKAVLECDELVFCYSVDPAHFKELDLGFKKADINRFKFLEQSVNELQHQLEKLGAHLIISEESATSTIPQLINEFDLTDIYAEEEYASEELAVIADLKNELPAINFHFFWGKTLYHKMIFPFKLKPFP